MALLMVPTALFHEFFVRGLLYTLLERWRGTVAAVVGTILLSLVIATPFIWRDAVAAEILIVEGFVLAASRWLTGSVAPALIAQGVQAGIGAAFLVVFALSSTG